MIRVYNDRFCWKKKKEDEVLIVKMKMEDFNSSSKPVRHIVFFHRQNLIGLLFVIT